MLAGATRAAEGQKPSLENNFFLARLVVLILLQRKKECRLLGGACVPTAFAVVKILSSKGNRWRVYSFVGQWLAVETVMSYIVSFAETQQPVCGMQLPDCHIFSKQLISYAYWEKKYERLSLMSEKLWERGTLCRCRSEQSITLSSSQSDPKIHSFIAMVVSNRNFLLYENETTQYLAWFFLICSCCANEKKQHQPTVLIYLDCLV